MECVRFEIAYRYYLCNQKAIAWDGIGNWSLFQMCVWKGDLLASVLARVNVTNISQGLSLCLFRPVSFLGQEGNHSFCQIYYVLPALRQERKSNNLPATYKDTFGYGIIEFSIMELVRVIESQKEIPKEHRIAAQITSHN